MASFLNKLLASLVPIGLGIFFWCVSDFMAKKVFEVYKNFLTSKLILRNIYQLAKLFVRVGSLILIGIGLLIFFTAKNVTIF
jgi:hypothetical protein